MKKINYLLLGVLGMMVASCGESIEPSYPQENPQNPILQDGDIVFEKYGVLASEETLNLEAYNNPDNSKINVLKVAKYEGMVADAQLVLSLEISNTADFKNSQSLELYPTDEDPTVYYANAYDWNTLQLNVFGNSIKPQDAYYRLPVLVKIQGTDYRYVGPDYYGLEGNIMETRMDPGYQIDENYYVFGTFIGGDTPGKGVKMYHDSRDVYDNPTFTYSFEVTEDQLTVGYSLMIAPEAVHDQNGSVAECYGKGSTAGTLELGGEPITITEAGPYMLEANMLDLTYTLKVAPPSLYVMDTQLPAGMSFGDVPQLGTTDNVVYEGMAGLVKGWGLTGQAAYKPTFFVNNPEIPVTTQQYTTKGSIMYETTGTPLVDANAIPLPDKRGLYYLNVNLQTLTYSAYKVNQVGIAGTMNDWGGNDENPIPDIPMLGLTNQDKPGTTAGSLTTLFLNWTVDLDLEADAAFKIRMNHQWGVDFGLAAGETFHADGQPINLSMGGADIKGAPAGSYTIKLYLNRKLVNGEMSPYYMTVTPKN